MIKTKYIFLITIILTCAVNAQSVRGLVNEGVDEYVENKFAEAEVNFKKAIEEDMESFESRFNLGDAIYKQGRFEEALEEFKNSMTLAETEEQRASIFHNIGNTFLKNQKLQESIGAYREALKLNPNDMETKYNLSYALKQMQDQQNQQNQQQQNQDQNDQNQDQEQNQDQQDQEQNQDQQDQQKEDEQKDQQQQQQPQESKDEISKEEAKRILEALKNNEAELQKKMREQKTKKSNVEKDW